MKKLYKGYLVVESYIDIVIEAETEEEANEILDDYKGRKHYRIDTGGSIVYKDYDWPIGEYTDDEKGDIQGEVHIDEIGDYLSEEDTEKYLLEKKLEEEREQFNHFLETGEAPTTETKEE